MHELYWWLGAFGLGCLFTLLVFGTASWGIEAMITMMVIDIGWMFFFALVLLRLILRFFFHIHLVQS